MSYSFWLQLTKLRFHLYSLCIFDLHFGFSSRNHPKTALTRSGRGHWAYRTGSLERMGGPSQDF